MNNQNFQNLKDLYNRKVGQYDSLKQRYNVCQEQIISLTSKEDTNRKASIFLQSLSDETRMETIDKISKIVTDALQTVKDKNLEFKMNLSIERNQPSLSLGVLDKRTGEVYSILESMGGGIADLVSIALRISLLCIWKPSLSKILILDESGKHISVKDQELLAEFVSKISHLLNIQFVWVTHSEVLTKSADKVFEVTQENGISRIEERTFI